MRDARKPSPAAPRKALARRAEHCPAMPRREVEHSMGGKETGSFSISLEATRTPGDATACAAWRCRALPHRGKQPSMRKRVASVECRSHPYGMPNRALPRIAWRCRAEPCRDSPWRVILDNSTGQHHEDAAL